MGVFIGSPFERLYISFWCLHIPSPLQTPILIAKLLSHPHPHDNFNLE